MSGYYFLFYVILLLNTLIKGLKLFNFRNMIKLIYQKKEYFY